jgi:hypothetical protein
MWLHGGLRCDKIPKVADNRNHYNRLARHVALNPQSHHERHCRRRHDFRRGLCGSARGRDRVLKEHLSLDPGPGQPLSGKRHSLCR